MRILFVLGFPNPFPGAGWTRIEFFAKDWSKKGHLVEVLGAFSYKSLDKRGVRKIGTLNIFNLIFTMNVHHPLIFAFNSVISFIVSTLFLIAKKPNVTVVSVPSGDAGLGALMACKLIRTKCVVDYRDAWEDYVICLANHKTEKLFYSIIKRITVRVYAKSQLVVAVTPNYMDALKQRGLSNVKLIPNGADVKTFKPLSSGKKNKVFTMFYSGGFGGYYRLDIVLKSVRELADRKFNDIRLVIAGTGEIEKVLGLASRLCVSGNVEYKGVINDKAELARLIGEADVGLIPYDDNPLWENSLPAKFFEYCACGIPVIATVYEDSLLAKLVREYRIGVTSPPMDEKKLAEATYRIYKDKSFRDAAGKRARLCIEERFDRNKIAEEFLELVETL